VTLSSRLSASAYSCAMLTSEEPLSSHRLASAPRKRLASACWHRLDFQLFSVFQGHVC